VSVATAPAEIASAVAELQAAFPERVQTYDDPAGLVVAVRDVALGERWTPCTGILWFLIPYHYPDSAIYPFYVTGARPTGGMINGLQDVTWRNEPAIQVSLRHTSWSPKLDTAVGSALQTKTWLATH
jgi:hypothetical protein